MHPGFKPKLPPVIRLPKYDPNEPPTPVFPYLNKFNYCSAPLASLSLVIDHPFSVKSMQISEEGSVGIIFVETEEGSFVLKCNNDAPTDAFFNGFAQLLDLHVPEMIVLIPTDLPFSRIEHQLLRYVEKDESIYKRVKSKLNYPYYILQTYYPSVSLVSVGLNRFINMLNTQKLHSIGLCIGFDLIINNADRFKVFWSGDGNINNVLIEVKNYDIHSVSKWRDREDLSVLLGEFVFIDHSGCLLDLSNRLASNNFEIYSKKLCMFHTQLLGSIKILSHEPTSPNCFNQLQQLRKQIQFFTQFSLGTEELLSVAYGIVYATSTFIRAHNQHLILGVFTGLLKQNEQSALKGQKAIQQQYWRNYWNTELQKIKMDYFDKIYEKLSAIYFTFSEITGKVEDKIGSVISRRAQKWRQKQSVAEDIYSEVRLSDPSQITPLQTKDDTNEDKKQGEKSPKWREKLGVFKEVNYR